MRRIAIDLLKLAFEIDNANLNVLVMELADDNVLFVMAEKVPQSSDEVVTYLVALYRIEKLKVEPEVVFRDIPTLQRAQVVFEELRRSA
jgi:hypothetical protein